VLVNTGVMRTRAVDGFVVAMRHLRGFTLRPLLATIAAGHSAVAGFVTGVCSTGKMDLVHSIGADHVIDYTREDFADGRQHYDLILDIGGNSRLSRLRRALTLTGTLVIAGGEGAKWTGVGGNSARWRSRCWCASS
jgi:NADPH:quinone reductase-like Zn-dependent oxidoreductase